MLDQFTPAAWHWIVGDDPTRAWSSATSGWVANWADLPATRIASLDELDDVLRRYGLPSPVVRAGDVRAEASRRMQTLFGARDADHLGVLISNAQREAARLHTLRLGIPGLVTGREWTADEAKRASELYAADAAIEAIRAASNAMEPDPPADFRDNARWP